MSEPEYKEKVEIKSVDYVALVKNPDPDKGVEGSELLSKVMIGQFHADELMLLMANKIGELQAEIKIYQEMVDQLSAHAAELTEQLSRLNNAK